MGVSRVEVSVSGRLTIFIWAKGNVQLTKEQCPVISLRLIRCHICFRCSSVVVVVVLLSAIVTALSMIADRHTTANHQEWEEKTESVRTRVHARKREKNNCFGTYADRAYFCSDCQDRANDHEADYEIKVFFCVISGRFFHLFFGKQRMLW